MRSDAQRNRERLIDVARHLFQERGMDTPLDEIAKQAGVGAGTLYRHFPTREALLDAVLETWVQRVQRAASDAVAAGSATDILLTWFTSYVELISIHKGAAAQITAQIGRDSSPAKAVYLDATARVLDAAKESGASFRDEVTALQACRMLGGVAAVSDAAELDNDETRAMIRILLLGTLTPQTSQPSRLHG